jgi:hypothetical protein
MSDQEPESSGASLRLPDGLWGQSHPDDVLHDAGGDLSADGVHWPVEAETVADDDLSPLDLWFGAEEDELELEAASDPVGTAERPATRSPARSGRAPVPAWERLTHGGRVRLLKALATVVGVVVLGLLFRSQVGRVPRPVVSAGTVSSAPSAGPTPLAPSTTPSTAPPSTTTSLVPTTLPAPAASPSPAPPGAGPTVTARPATPTAPAVVPTTTPPPTEPAPVPTTVAVGSDPDPSIPPTTRGRRVTTTQPGPTPTTDASPTPGGVGEP